MSSSSLHQHASAVFVVTVFSFTLVVCIAVSMYFTSFFANKRSKSFGPLTGLAVALLHFTVTYPQVFVAVDMVDLNLCPMHAVIFTDNGNSCYIPVDTIWTVLKGLNLAYTIFGAPFAVCWLWNRHRSLFKRLLLSIASALCVLVSTGLLVVIPYVARDVRTRSMTGTLLVSKFQAYQQDNITNSDCYSAPTSPEDMNFQQWIAFEDSITNASESCSWAESLQSLVSNKFVAATTFYGYVMSVYAVVAAPVYTIFVGVGLVTYPWSLLTMFAKRPRMPIGKSEFIRRGRAIMVEARKIQLLDAQLMQEVKEAPVWFWKKVNLRKRRRELNRRLAVLEATNHCLSQLYPEGEQRDLVWTFQVLWKWCHLVRGLFAVLFSLLWLTNMALFQLPAVPISPWLNAMIVINPDDSVGAYFQNMAVFCFVACLLLHLYECTFDGLRACQNAFRFLTVHEYRPHSTQMSSFLINCWCLAGIANAKLHMITFNLSGALYGTSLLDVTVKETSIIDQRLRVRPDLHATLAAGLLFGVIGFTLVVKLSMLVSSPASHFMQWLQRCIDLSLPMYPS